MDFPGKHRLIAALDAAVAAVPPADVAAPTAVVAAALRLLVVDPAVRLPAALQHPAPGRYARRELHTGPTLGYSVIAMTWGPGHATPVHDHDGAWCVEGIWQGRLRIGDYVPVERDGERWRFRRGSTTEAGPGDTGSLQPPDEYHTVCNPHDSQVAISLHVYARRLERCQVYLPAGEGEGDGDGTPDRNAPDPWLRRHTRELATDGDDTGDTAGPTCA